MAKEFTLEEARSAPVARPSAKPFTLNEALGRNQEPDTSPQISAPMGDDFGSAIMAASEMPKPERKVYTGSVFDTQPFNPEFNPAEANRLSKRAYAEDVNKPARRVQEMRATPQNQLERSAGEAVLDTGLGLMQGANAIPQSISANILGGDNPVTDYFKSASQAGQRAKSPFLQSQQAEREAFLQNVLQNQGELANARASFYTMFSPAGADVIAQGTGSMIPTVGMSLMGLGSAALTATNVLANAGEAAQKTAGDLLKMSPEDWSKSQVYLNLRESGMSHQDAAKMLAPLYALPSQVVGGIVGGVSGSTGFEKTLAGKGIKGGIQGRLKRAGAELAGEELETIAPGITGNATQNLIDDKTNLFSGVGRDVVETAFGSLPGSAMAAAGRDQNGKLPLGIDALLAPKEKPIPSAEQMMRDRGFLIPEQKQTLQDVIADTTTPPAAPAVTAKPPEAPAVPAPAADNLSQQRNKEQQSVLDLEQEMEAPEAEKGTQFTLEEATAPPAIAKPDEDYSSKSLEELEALRGAADQTNDALDMAALQKHFGPEVAAAYEKMSRGQRNKWWSQNATDAMEQDSSVFNGVNEELLDEYIKAYNDFDTSSPRALGRSVGLLARNINEPRFIGSPEFVRLKNALAYAKQQGFSEAEVLGGMRERAVEWAGADAQELFKDLFKAKPAEANAGITAPAKEDIPLADEEFIPFGEEDLANEPAPERPEVQTLLEQQAQANKDLKSLSKRTAGTSLFKVLTGTLKDSEMSELGGRSREGSKNPFMFLAAKKGKPGSSMEDMVESGALDLFLPPKMRVGNPMYDNGESAAYIREKLIQGQYYTHDTQMAISIVTEGIRDLDKLIQEELSIDDINKEIERAFDEQREADLNAEKAAPSGETGSAAEGKRTEATNDELDKREAQLEREAQLNQREARLLEERKRLEEERLKLESPTKEDVADQEEKKAKAAELDEKEQIKKESEAGAGQFELTREEGRQDTTGNLFDQPAPEPELVAISSEQERKEAMKNFVIRLQFPIPPFMAKSAKKVQLLKPKDLTSAQIREIVGLASDALDLGLPASVLGNVTAAGSTRMDARAVMSQGGSLMIAKHWKDSTTEQKLQTLIHEFGHAVDNEGNGVSGTANWSKAHSELQSWYSNSGVKSKHPLAYPFAPQFKGEVRPKPESFAQAFAYYFTSPVDLQKNAPEAYSQIQAIVERIQDGSQKARAAGTTATGTAGIKIQPTRVEKDTTVRPNSGEVSTAVGATTGLEDRAAGKVNNAVEFREDIPNESWLQGKIDYALETPRNRFGVPKMSSQTGYFTNPVLVPARWFKDVKGERGEQENVRQESLSAIRKIIRETGKMPLNDDGTEYVPYIEIGYDGKPWISEGNHRIMAAIAEGMKYIPIQLRYFDGGQRRAGVWGPGNITSITERAEGEQLVDINASISPTVPNTPAFKRWFGDSKVVAEGRPLLMYTGTSKDKDFKKFNIPRNGAWFTSDPMAASQYAIENDSKGFKWEGGRPVEVNTADRVMPVYLRIENPYTMTEEDTARINKENYKRAQGQFFDELRAKGYDGVDFGHGVLVVLKEPNQIKSAIGNKGEYSLKVQDINASAGNTIFNQKPLVNWTAPEFTDKDRFIYAIQNRQIDTKRVVDEITKSIGVIDDRWNPYLMEELFHGRAAKQTKDFSVNELRPLLKEMDNLGITIPELEEYLHNKHAEERNDQVAKVNPTMPDGGSGIDTADARKYLAGLTPEQKKNFEQANRMVKVITSNTRQMMVDSGLESQETIDTWDKTYGEYVPLNREDVDYSSNQGQSVGQGYSVRGSSSKRAAGSTRKVVDILANIAMQRERTIVRAEKNRVATALYGLALKNPNPKFWVAVNPDSKKDMQATIDELVNMGLTAQDALNVMKEPTQTVIDPKTGLVTQRVNPILRGANNVMAVRVNGKDRFVFFNQNNDRANRMVTALKNLDADQLGWIMSNAAAGTRYFASINTQYNPVFGVYNFLRDIEGAALQLSTTELAGKQNEVRKNILPALAGIYSQLRADHDGKVVSGQWSKLWEEFQQQGGQTGFRDQFSRSEERGRALERELNKMSQGAAHKVKDAVFNWLSDYNETMENAVRLAAYKAALDNGSSKDRAASLAKNLTVNFNRKGQISTQAGALYAFFNSAVQGTTRLAQTITGPAGKTILAGGFILGTIQAVGLAAMGFGDDDPPDFIKDKNFIIPLMNGKYLAIPMPLGYNVIPSTARILTEGAIDFAQGKKVNAPKRIAHLAGLLLDAFNPIGNAGWSAQTFAPTLADPVVALLENKDWTGKPIAREDFNKLDPTPGYLRAKEAASIFGKKISEFMNYASGGTKDVPGIASPTPDQIDYLIGQATGGLGREILKAASTAQAIKTGEDLPPYKIPLVGRFYGDIKGSSSVANHFYDNIKKMNEYENTVKGMRERRENVQQLYKENPEARAFEFANEIEREVQKLRKLRRSQVEKDAPKESVQATEKRITYQMNRLNDRVESLEKKRSTASN